MHITRCKTFQPHIAIFIPFSIDIPFGRFLFVSRCHVTNVVHVIFSAVRECANSIWCVYYCLRGQKLQLMRRCCRMAARLISTFECRKFWILHFHSENERFFAYTSDLMSKCINAVEYERDENWSVIRGKKCLKHGFGQRHFCIKSCFSFILSGQWSNFLYFLLQSSNFMALFN